jgi:hypothetical protein
VCKISINQESESEVIMSLTVLTADEIRLLDEYEPALKEAGLSTKISAIITQVNDIINKVKGDYLVSKPGLTIGSSAATAVKNAAAFDFTINGVRYTKAISETAFAGTENDVPSTGDLYGAWRLVIDAAGTITIQEAAANDTGYATSALALAGLPAVPADKAAVGTVTALAADGTAFDPGTTELSAANITDAYADGGTALEAI